MNQRTTISAVLSVAAAAGITAGALIHSANNPSSEHTATPARSTVTSLPTTPTTPATGATASGGTTTVPVSIQASPRSVSSTSSAKPAATSPGATPAGSPSSTSAPKPARPISAASLVGPSEFAAAGVARLRVDQTSPTGPDYAMSACPVGGNGPAELSKRGVVWERYMSNPGLKANTFQLLVDFRTSGGADGQVKFLNDWHDHCGTPYPEAPSQNFTVGKSHTESLPGVDQARWWDLTFTNEGKLWMETVAWTRKGNQVNIVVFGGLASDIRNTDMTTLMTGMVRKAA